MLYDNALLVRAYLHAWQVTKDPAFKRIVEEMLDFTLREMTAVSILHWMLTSKVWKVSSMFGLSMKFVKR
jgi:uncharacterized protein YyaL (SSP411 family)